MQASKLNFLVVEDDDFQRQTLVDMLHFLGSVEVVQASDGKQALEMLLAARGRPVDVVLCDLEMPEMDGMAFFRHLGSEHPDLAIVIISALDGALISSVEKMTQAYGLRLLGAVEKPITLKRIEALISLYDTMPSGRQRPVTVAAAPSFSLEEILQGVHDNQFEPFFQPKVDLVTGRIAGAEALARWIHPEHGVIAPYAFIDQLEQNGKIDGLTFAMLEKSAIACRLLHEQGHSAFTVSVNLSLTSLTDITLADMVTKVMHDAKVDPRHIVLEVTESAAMTEVAHPLENLARLRMHGFGLSIDDYGTGYSSMQQITRIAFSELKIDQSFVKGFADNQALRIMVESSIEMAHKLRMKCVAEGVETQHDLDALKSMGCDMAQGYLIAKPMGLMPFLGFCGEYSGR